MENETVSDFITSINRDIDEINNGKSTINKQTLKDCRNLLSLAAADLCQICKENQDLWKHSGSTIIDVFKIYVDNFTVLGYQLEEFKGDYKSITEPLHNLKNAISNIKRINEYEDCQRLLTIMLAIYQYVSIVSDYYLHVGGVNRKVNTPHFLNYVRSQLCATKSR